MRGLVAYRMTVLSRIIGVAGRPMRGTGCRRFPDARRLPSTRNGRQPAELRDQRAARAGDDPDPPLGPSISNHTVVPGPMVRGATPHRLASSSTIPRPRPPSDSAFRLSCGRGVPPPRSETSTRSPRAPGHTLTVTDPSP